MSPSTEEMVNEMSKQLVSSFRNLTTRGITAHNVKVRINEFLSDKSEEYRIKFFEQIESLYYGVELQRLTISRGTNKGKLSPIIKIYEPTFRPNDDAIAMFIANVDAETLKNLDFCFKDEKNLSMIGLVFDGTDDKIEYKNEWADCAEDIIVALTRFNQFNDDVDWDGIKRAEQYLEQQS